MKTLVLVLAITWVGLWLTPDQQGQRQFQRGDFKEAADSYRDPLRKGVAWYRAGEFEQAAHEFARSTTPEARYNEGNAWLMLGKYETAIARYESALEQRPDWKEAQDNRDLAEARAQARDPGPGDLGDQKLGADEIVFDQNKPKGGQDTVVAGDKATSDASVQALWLRRVQTKPADFLKAKFAYQQAQDTKGDEP